MTLLDTGHQPLSSSKSRDGRAVICGSECPGPPVSSNSLQKGKQVLRSDLIQKTQALSQELLGRSLGKSKYVY